MSLLPFIDKNVVLLAENKFGNYIFYAYLCINKTKQEMEIDYKEIREQIENVRRELVESVKKKMRGLSVIEAYDLDEGSSPILMEDPTDCEFTFTLDRITQRKDGGLVFDGSSSCENAALTDDEIGLEVLCEIAEYLDEHEDKIEELVNAELDNEE